MKINYRRDLWQVLPKGNTAEIGVAEGLFSADILSWNTGELHYLVDRWEQVADQKGDASNPSSWHSVNFAAATARVKKYGSRAVFLKGDSKLMAAKVPDHSLALCYIDGDHSYLGVTCDIMAWKHKLMKGGIMAFHDYENPNYGVKPAVDEYCQITGHSVYLLPEDKMEDAGAYFIC